MTEQQLMSDAEREALAYVRDIKGFYTHLASYVVTMLGLFVIWLILGHDYPWFLWPILGWGMGVASHGIAVFEVFSLFSPEWERAQVEKRLRQTRS